MHLKHLSLILKADKNHNVIKTRIGAVSLVTAAMSSVEWVELGETYIENVPKLLVIYNNSTLESTITDGRY